MIVKCEVTQEHIENGQRLRPDACAVALAIKAVVHDSFAVFTDGAFADIIDPATSRECTVKLPPEVREFVQRFDNLNRVAPLEFSVDLPMEALRRIPL